MTMLLTFTFNPSRESDFHMSIALAKEHFPGAFRQGYPQHQINTRGLRITCTSDEFCKWMYERDQMGFVNRMHQLNIAISYTREHHFPRNVAASQIPDRDRRMPEVLTPIEYSTPSASLDA